MPPGLRSVLQDKFNLVVLLGLAATKQAVVAAFGQADQFIFIGHSSSEDCQYGLKSFLQLHNELLDLKVLFWVFYPLITDS
jgi:hypothetical protein